MQVTWQAVLRTWAERHFSRGVTEHIMSRAASVTAGVQLVLNEILDAELPEIETLLPALVATGAEFRDEDTIREDGLLALAVQKPCSHLPNLAALRAIVQYCTPKSTVLPHPTQPCRLCVCLSCAVWWTDCIPVRDWLLTELEARCEKDLIHHYATEHRGCMRVAQLRSLIPHILAGRLALDEGYSSWKLVSPYMREIVEELAAAQTRRRNQIDTVLLECLHGIDPLVQLTCAFLLSDSIPTKVAANRGHSPPRPLVNADRDE